MNAKAQKYIPLTEATYYILLSLEAVAWLRNYANGRRDDKWEVKLGPGTLYGNTTKLLKREVNC